MDDIDTMMEDFGKDVTYTPRNGGESSVITVLFTTKAANEQVEGQSYNFDSLTALVDAKDVNDVPKDDRIESDSKTYKIVSYDYTIDRAIIILDLQQVFV